MVRRLAFILLAIYLVYLGGSAYYTLVFPIRVFHHLLLTGLLALWLINRLRHRQGLPQTPLNAPIGAALLVWVFSALASADPRMAFENLWLQLLHILFFFILVDLFRQGRQRLVLETQFMLAALVIFLSGLELASWYFGLGIIPGTQLGWIDVIGPGAWLPLIPYRLTLALNVSTLLSGYVAPLVILAVGWALTAHQQYRRALWLLAGLLTFVLVFTLSRGGLLAIFGAAGALVVLRLAQMPTLIRRLPARWLIGGAIAVGVAGLSLFLTFSLRTSANKDWSDAGRLDMWTSAAEMFRAQPLTGVGPGLFGRTFRQYRDPTLTQDKLVSAHNAYLNTAAETGLPGLAVSLWLAVAFLRAWYQSWRGTTSTVQRIRLETVLAALIGLGIHSLVDVFTITPIVLLILLLAAYGITPLPERIALRPPLRYTHPAFVVVALVLVIGYGGWFIQLDRAEAAYRNSLSGRENALAEAQTAAALDPALNLYDLHITYLFGEQRPTAEAIIAYQQALDLESTWDVGWMNLAALYLRQEDWPKALEALDRARHINQRTPAVLHWARLAEEFQAAPAEDIITAYAEYLPRVVYNRLPLADFWWETDLRRQAVERYLTHKEVKLDWQYRILAAHDPERAAALVPENPQTAEDYWVAGEHALTIDQDTAAAITYFTAAIERARTNGDYYASRARAELHLDPDAARRDLDIATLLTTWAEYPNAIRAELAATPEEAHQLRADALPQRPTLQEFAAALYGRPAVFELLPEVRAPGPGSAAMQPWYTLAEEYLQTGNTERALKVYNAILEYAPDETGAREKKQELSP